MKGWPPRFCAACGGRLTPIRLEGRTRRRCRRCGWTFYPNPVPAAVAVIVRRGRILLTRRAHPPYAGTWDLPGGFLEPDEAPDVALRRELDEELGVRARRVALIGFVSDRYGAGGFPVLTAIYRVMLAAGTLRPADDVSEARWFAPRAIPFREIAFPALRRALRMYATSRRIGRISSSGR